MKTVVSIALALVILIFWIGVYIRTKKRVSKKMGKLLLFGSAIGSTAFLIFLGVMTFLTMSHISPSSASAQVKSQEAKAETNQGGSVEVKESKPGRGDLAVGLGYIAAALAVGLAAAGAAVAVGISGSAAIGAVSENPDILGKTLIYVGLAEGVAIYGLLIAIFILTKL